jgi:hypothetical protein
MASAGLKVGGVGQRAWLEHVSRSESGQDLASPSGGSNREVPSNRRTDTPSYAFDIDVKHWSMLTNR